MREYSEGLGEISRSNTEGSESGIGRAMGRHGEGIRKTSRTMVKALGNIGEGIAKHRGDRKLGKAVGSASGRHHAGMGRACGRHGKGMWEASERH